MVELGAESTGVGFERPARQPGDAVTELVEQRVEAPVELVAPSAAPAIDDLLERPVDVDPHTARGGTRRGSRTVRGSVRRLELAQRGSGGAPLPVYGMRLRYRSTPSLRTAPRGFAPVTAANVATTGAVSRDHSIERFTAGGSVPNRRRRRHHDRVAVDRRVAVDHEAESVVGNRREHDRHAGTRRGVAARPPAGLESQHPVGNDRDQRDPRAAARRRSPSTGSRTPSGRPLPADPPTPRPRSPGDGIHRP